MIAAIDRQLKIGDRVEFLCDVRFGDIDIKAKNPDAKLALTGECAEVCGVRGTRASLSVGGEPFDWPLRLIKKVELPVTSTKLRIGDRLIAPNKAIGVVRSVNNKKITIDWGKSGAKALTNECTHEEIQDYGYKPVLDPEKFSISENDGSSGEAQVDELEPWNPADFGEVPHQVDADGQATIFFDDSNEPPEPDDFKSIKEYEEAWEKWNSLQGISSQEEAGIQKAQLPQDTHPSGQLMLTPTLVASTESDFLARNSLSKTSVPSQMSLFSDSQYQISQSLLPLVQTFPWLVSEMDLLEFADNCFLRDLGSLDFIAHPHSSLKMLVASLAQITELPSLKSSKRLQVWGIAAPGNLGMETATSPKTENGFSSWAITADIRATTPKPGKKTLQEIFETQAIPVKVYVDGVAVAQESPALCAGGWQHRSPLHRDKRGASFAVLYRAAGGDRIYHDQAPCLRSPNNAGNGAYKVREYKGETYLERPINATEAEQLMGWEVGSTAIGINREGDEITISQTQRIKMLGNGIIPAEITDILAAIKPILERKLESEIPQGLDFAYKQLRQKGMSHQEALEVLGPN